MKVSPVCNATLLQIIANRKEITYSKLKKEYCTPISSKVISSRNVMFDSDLKVLESEGYIKISDDLITFIDKI